MKDSSQGFSVILIILLLGVLIIGAVAGSYFLLNKGKMSSLPTSAQNLSPENSDEEKAVTSSQQIKSPHFVDSSPKHGEVYVASPYNIVINFNFDLSPKSEIRLLKDGKSVEIEKTTVDANKTTLRTKLPESLANGKYTVSYTACWPDNTCHDGQFEFSVDSSKLSEYKDETSKKELQIAMNNLSFGEDKVIVKKGTKVTWVNDESVSHYVNTDPHPGHDHLVYLNSKELKGGNTYAYSFTEVGEFAYHCSLHYPQMVGRIVVVE